MPVELVGYLAEQLDITDPLCVKSYSERDKTRLEHLWEIRDADPVEGVLRDERVGTGGDGALERAAEILGLGCEQVDASVVSPRRLAELSRYGMEGKATLLRRHADSRRLATLLASVV